MLVEDALDLKSSVAVLEVTTNATIVDTSLNEAFFQQLPAFAQNQVNYIQPANDTRTTVTNMNTQGTQTNQLASTPQSPAISGYSGLCVLVSFISS
jgi:hypothetical protein